MPNLPIARTAFDGFLFHSCMQCAPPRAEWELETTATLPARGAEMTHHTSSCEQLFKAAVYVQGESGDLPMGRSPSFYRTLTHRTSWIIDKVELWHSPSKRSTVHQHIKVLQAHILEWR